MNNRSDNVNNVSPSSYLSLNISSLYLLSKHTSQNVPPISYLIGVTIPRHGTTRLSWTGTNVSDVFESAHCWSETMVYLLHPSPLHISENKLRSEICKTNMTPGQSLTTSQKSLCTSIFASQKAQIRIRVVPTVYIVDSVQWHCKFPKKGWGMIVKDNKLRGWRLRSKV